MGRLTGGLIAIKPVKLKTKLTLDEVRDCAIAAAYNGEGESASAGWGSSDDDDSVLDAPVIARLSVGAPALLPATDRLPRRLRMRYYWDQLDKRLLRMAGAGADWSRLHVRRAVDVVIFDDRTDGKLSVLLSSRDIRQLNSDAIPALRALTKDADGSSTLETEELAEGLDPDFFTWLLYKLQGPDPTVGQSVQLNVITEISSRDRLFRGARFTEEATFERIELAALIAMGKTRFGPAKVGVTVDDLDAYFHMELHLDGGFVAYRDSQYDSADLIPPFELGHTLVDDLWATVLPRVRDQYNADSDWRLGGRDKFQELAVNAVRAILPPERP